MAASILTDLIGTRVILNQGPGCPYQYRPGVIDLPATSDHGAHGYPVLIVRLDPLPGERTPKRVNVALVRGNEAVKDKPETRQRILDWLAEHDPDHRARGWL